MQPTLTWVDLTASDRDKMRRVLDLFNEQGTLDEMGLGSLRDTVSDALFPGTSYIQTRLRYVLFVPWIYQRLEDKRVSSADVERAGRRAEVDLIGPLERSDDNQGTIGVRAQAALARLPSTLYWSALTRWGIFRHPQGQGWYHARFASLADRRGGDGRADDPGVVWTREPNWHPRLPEPPREFPWKASFALTCEEADFVRGRLEERCAGTLLAWLARNGSTAPAEDLWDDPDALRAPVSIRDIVELARRFSLHVEGMPLLYNLLVAERRRDVLGERDVLRSDGPEVIEHYRIELAKWATREAEEQPFDSASLWELVVRGGKRPREPQRRFVESWSRRILEVAPDQVAEDTTLRTLITQRECQLKSARARLANLNRLREWAPGVGVGRMDFRWVRVRRFMMDLHQGLAA